MLRYEQAEELAREWVQRIYGDSAILNPRVTEAKPYGWIFGYNSPGWVERGDPDAMLYGNGPIIVNRFNSKLFHLPTQGMKQAIARYEAGLPTSQRE